MTTVYYAARELLRPGDCVCVTVSSALGYDTPREHVVGTVVSFADDRLCLAPRQPHSLDERLFLEKSTLRRLSLLHSDPSFDVAFHVALEDD